jgi:hypothetical protein
MGRLPDGAAGRQPAFGRVIVEGGGTPTRAAGINDAERAPLVREAFYLEYVTLAWMVIEAGVSIGAGVAARSITLLAFGIDSLIELTSAGVLIWRLTVELRPPLGFRLLHCQRGLGDQWRSAGDFRQQCGGHRARRQARRRYERRRQCLCYAHQQLPLLRRR